MKLSALFTKPQDIEIGGESFPIMFCNAALGYLEDYYEGKISRLISRYVPELRDQKIKESTKKDIEALKARNFMDGVSIAHLFVNAGTKVDFAVNDILTLLFAGLMHIDEGKRFPDRDKFTEQAGKITNERKQVLQLQILIALTSVLMTDEQSERFDVLAAKADDDTKNAERPEDGGTTTGGSITPSA